MDPVTAAFNAIAAFFTFAASQEGQKMLADIRATNQKIAEDIAVLVGKLASAAK